MHPGCQVGKLLGNSKPKNCKSMDPTCQVRRFWENSKPYRRLRGLTQSGNRFRFRFVFVSCVRAGGRGEAAWARMGRVLPTLVARSQTFAPGRFGSQVAFCAGARVLSFFGQKCTICKGFLQWDCSGCAGARVLRECNCKTLNTSLGARVLRLFDSKS